VTEDAAKVEVLEFFSYGCIHCFRLHPFIKKWAAGAAKDVEFKRIPVTFDRPQMRPMAKLFYALEASGDMAKLDDEVFKRCMSRTSACPPTRPFSTGRDKGCRRQEIHRRLQLLRRAEQSGARRADDQVIPSPGTPQVYVDGRFGVRNEGVSGYEQIPMITSQLVDKARAEKGKKK